MAALADYTDGLEAKGLPGGSAEGGVMQGLYFRVIGAGTGEVVEGRAEALLLIPVLALDQAVVMGAAGLCWPGALTLSPLWCVCCVRACVCVRVHVCVCVHVCDGDTRCRRAQRGARVKGIIRTWREEAQSWQDLPSWKRETKRLLGCELQLSPIPNYCPDGASGRLRLAHLQPQRCPGFKSGAGVWVLVASEWQEDFN